MGFRPALLGRVLGPEALLHGHPDEVLERDVTLGVVDENGLTQIEGGGHRRSATRAGCLARNPQTSKSTVLCNTIVANNTHDDAARRFFSDYSSVSGCARRHINTTSVAATPPANMANHPPDTDGTGSGDGVVVTIGYALTSAGSNNAISKNRVTPNPSVRKLRISFNLNRSRQT